MFRKLPARKHGAMQVSSVWAVTRGARVTFGAPLWEQGRRTNHEQNKDGPLQRWRSTRTGTTWRRAALAVTASNAIRRRVAATDVFVVGLGSVGAFSEHHVMGKEIKFFVHVQRRNNHVMGKETTSWAMFKQYSATAQVPLEPNWLRMNIECMIIVNDHMCVVIL